MMRIRRLLTLSAAIIILAGGGVYPHQAQSQPLQNQINATLVTDEADAVLQNLAMRKANQALSDADLQRLFSSDGYVRLKRREAA